MSNAHANTAPSDDQVLPASHARGRRTGRFNTTGLNCSLGKILDLCRDGMRVEARSVPTGSVTVEITDRNEAVYVTAEVVWSRRVGMFRKEMGLRFIDAPRETVQKLALIASARSRPASV